MSRPLPAPVLRHCSRAERSGTGPGRSSFFPAEPLPSFQSRKGPEVPQAQHQKGQGTGPHFILLALGASGCSWGFVPPPSHLLTSLYLPCGPQVVVHLTDDLLSRASMTVVNGCPTLTINVSTAREHWLEGMLRHEIGRPAPAPSRVVPNELHRHALCNGVFIVVFGKKQWR